MRFWLLFLAALWAAFPARAGWYPADLPYNDYLSAPITGIAAPGVYDVWAVTTYSLAWGDSQHARWNTNAYHSRNDGLLWDLPFDAPSTTDPTPNRFLFQDTELFAVAFANRDHGWLLGWQRPAFGVTDPPGALVAYHTTDGGRAWSVATLPHADAVSGETPNFALVALGPGRAVAAHGHLVFDTSDGVTWTERAGTFPDIRAMENTPAGIRVAGTDGTDGTAAIGGWLTETGVTVDVRGDGAFSATAWAGTNRGWVAGGGRILGTRDGGATWTEELYAPGVTFHALSAPDALHAWAVGDSEGDTDRGVAYRTADGGATWTLNHRTPRALRAVAFRGPFHGWAAGEDGLYRYVPSEPQAPGDTDDNGQADSVDVRALLRRAAGLNVGAPADVRSGPLSVARAVAAWRAAQAPATLDDPSRVVVVYNTLWFDYDGNGVPDSYQVARHYAQRRGIPESNLVPTTWNNTDSFYIYGQDPNQDGGRTNWTDAYRAVVEPIKAKIDALGRDAVDAIVFAYGMPHTVFVGEPNGGFERIVLDTSIGDLYRTDAENWSSASPYVADGYAVAERYGRARFRQGGRPLGQPVASAEGRVTRDPFYLVGRIDGPGPDACMDMVDNALFAERHFGPGGYEGFAYIDDRAAQFNWDQPYDLNDLRAWNPWYYGYDGYDKSIARTVLTFHNRGLPWREEFTGWVIGTPADQGAPTFRDGTPARYGWRAMFYAGWYNYASYQDVWEWLPGSVGVDFNSLSGIYFRQWGAFGGSALVRGLSAFAGVVDEPYNYHPKPDVLMEYLARGFSFGEAAALATERPRTARAIFLGDPLYRPFAPRNPAPAPVPTLSVTATRGASGWTVRLVSDVPVRAVLRLATDGAEPGPDSPTVLAWPGYYACRQAFSVPDGPAARYVIQATDPTGRVTDAAAAALP